VDIERSREEALINLAASPDIQIKKTAEDM
jgi:hypothetical protein